MVIIMISLNNYYKMNVMDPTNIFLDCIPREIFEIIVTMCTDAKKFLLLSKEITSVILMPYLISTKSTNINIILREALEKIDLGLIKMCFHLGTKPFNTNEMKIKSYTIPILEICHEYKCTLNVQLFKYAAEIGSIELLEFLRLKFNSEFPWTFYSFFNISCTNWDMMSAAIKSEKIEILEWCKENRCHLVGLLICALHGNKNNNYNIEMFLWLLDNGALFDRYEICDEIIYTNNFEVLKICIQRGYPLSSKTIYGIVQKGNMAMFKYVIESGYIWRQEETLVFNFLDNHPELIEWRMEHHIY